MTHVHVGLVVPGLDVEEDGGLGDHLRLLGLLLVVGLKPLLGDSLLLLVILLLVGSEQVDIIIVIIRGRGGSCLGGGLGRGAALEGVHTGLERQNQGLQVISHCEYAPIQYTSTEVLIDKSMGEFYLSSVPCSPAPERSISS